MSSQDTDALAESFAAQGRDELLSRFRDAYAKAAGTHADFVSIDPERIETMVQRSAAEADGLQWRRALAGVASRELGIELGQALAHPAVIRAHQLAGAPSYESALADLAVPAPPAPTPPAPVPRVIATVPAPAPAPAVPARPELPVPEVEPEPLSVVQVEPGPEPSAAAAPQPPPVPDVEPEPLSVVQVEPGPEPIPEAALEPLPIPEAAPEPLPIPEAALEPLPIPEAAPEPLATPEVEPEPLPTPVAEVESESDFLPGIEPEADEEPVALIDQPTMAYEIPDAIPPVSAPAASEPDPVSALPHDGETEFEPEGDADADANEPVAEALEADFTYEYDALEADGAVGDTVEFSAVHLGGVASLPASEEIVVHLSADGLDLVQQDGNIVGRLDWSDIAALEVTVPHGRRRKRGSPRLVVHTPGGSARFEVPALSGEELTGQVQPLMTRFGTP